jgi:hypothetical protein
MNSTESNSRPAISEYQARIGSFSVCHFFGGASFTDVDHCVISRTVWDSVSAHDAHQNDFLGISLNRQDFPSIRFFLFSFSHTIIIFWPSSRSTYTLANGRGLAESWKWLYKYYLITTKMVAETRRNCRICIVILELYILWRVGMWLQTDFGLVNRFIDHAQVVTTNDYKTIAISTLYSSLEHTV